MVITTQELIPKSLKEFLQFKEHKQLKFQNKSQHVIVLHLSIQWTVFTCNPFPHQSLCCLYSLKALSKPERSSPLMWSAWLLFYIHLFVIMKWISWSKQIHYSIVGPEVCLDQVKSFHHPFKCSITLYNKTCIQMSNPIHPSIPFLPHRSDMAGPDIHLPDHIIPKWSSSAPSTPWLCLETVHKTCDRSGAKGQPCWSPAPAEYEADLQCSSGSHYNRTDAKYSVQTTFQ